MLTNHIQRVIFNKDPSSGFCHHKQQAMVCGGPSRISSMNFLDSNSRKLYPWLIISVIFGLITSIKDCRPKLVGEAVSQVLCDDYGSITIMPIKPFLVNDGEITSLNNFPSWEPRSLVKFGGVVGSCLPCSLFL